MFPSFCIFIRNVDFNAEDIPLLMYLQQWNKPHQNGQCLRMKEYPPVHSEHVVYMQAVPYDILST